MILLLDARITPPLARMPKFRGYPRKNIPIQSSLKKKKGLISERGL
jgi:hypothetical protein